MQCLTVIAVTVAVVFLNLYLTGQLHREPDVYDWHEFSHRPRADNRIHADGTVTPVYRCGHCGRAVDGPELWTAARQPCPARVGIEDPAPSAGPIP